MTPRSNEASTPAGAAPLRILIAMCYLVHRTGAEMFTRDLAMWLRRRGHAVTVFATAFGDMADELRWASISCITDVADMGARPDVIIGNTQYETVRALLHFHDVPTVTICHDRSADHGRPARFSQVVSHVAVDENCAERLAHEFGIALARIELIQNGIDLARFLPRVALPATPRSAVIFSNYASHDAQLAEVRAACMERGLSLDVIGQGTGNHLPDPAAALGHYDIVFGKGRCATEALVTGNAVVVLDPSSGMGEMVTAASVALGRQWNFGRALMTRPITRQNVLAELDRFDAPDATQAAAWMRTHGGLDVSLGALEQLLLRVVGERGVVQVSAEQRASEAAGYMDDWLRRGPVTVQMVDQGLLHRHIDGLQQGLNAQQHLHQAQADTLRSEARRHAEHAEQILGRLEAAEAALAAARAHAAQANAQVDAVHASRSWRITAPLRRLITLVRSGAKAA